MAGFDLRRAQQQSWALCHLRCHVVDSEFRARMAAARALINGKFDREIVATKGHPRSGDARRLMDERVARGERPDGRP